MSPKVQNFLRALKKNGVASSTLPTAFSGLVQSKSAGTPASPLPRTKKMFNMLYKRAFRIKRFSKSPRRLLNRPYLPKCYTVSYSKNQCIIHETGTTPMFDQALETAEYIGSFAKSVASDVIDDAKQSIKDKWDEFCNSDFLKAISSPTIDDVYSILQKMKPINLFNLIAQMATAETKSERTSVATAICELYDLFWTHELKMMSNILIGIFAEILGFFLRAKWTNERDAELYMEDQGKFTISGDSCVRKLLDNFGFLNCEIEDGALKIIAAIIGVYLIVTGGSITSLKQMSVNKIIKRAHKFAQSIKSFNMLTDGIPKVWAFVLNEVASIFGIHYQSSESEAIANFRTELLEFKKETAEIISLLNNSPITILLDVQRLNKCYHAMDKLDKLYYDLLRQEKNTANTKPLFDEIRKNVDSIRKFVDSMKEETSQKVEPFVVHVTGDAGIGKSQFVNWFTKQFGMRLHKEFPETAHWKPSTYTRNFKDQFWSGYYGQMFVCYDDFGQDKEDKDHSDLMSYKNPNRTHLNISENADKGRLFSSLGVICCSNDRDVTSSATIKHTEALKRRFEVSVYAFDSNMEKFRETHKVSPGKFEKENYPKKAMITDINGKEIPYFCKDFGHLDFWRVITEDAEKRHHAEPEKVTSYDIVDLAMNYYKHYREEFINSMKPCVTAEEFNDADSVVSSDSRRHGESFVAAIAKSDELKVLNAAENAKKKVEFEHAVDETYKNLWTVIPKMSKKEKADLEKAKADKKEAIKTLEISKTAKTAALCKEFAAALKEEPDYSLEIMKQLDQNKNPWVVECDTSPQVPDIPVEFTAAYVPPTIEEIDPFAQYGELPITHAQNQSKDELDSVAKSFVAHSHEKGSIYCLVGAPGTGKTTLMRKVNTIAQHENRKFVTLTAPQVVSWVPTNSVYYLEDITASAESFEAARKKIMTIYDGESPCKMLIISLNEEMAKAYCTIDGVFNEEMWSAFARRCKFVRFEYQVKRVSSVLRKKEYYDAADVEEGIAPYPKMVSISYNNAVFLDHQVIERFITEMKNVAEPYKDSICMSVPYIGANQYTPNFKLEISENAADAFKKYYEEPSSMLVDLMSKKVSIVKGKITEGASIARQFCGGNGPRPEWPGSLDKFIVLINNSKFTSSKAFVTELKCADCTIVIMPKKDDPKIIRCFKQCEHLELTRETAMDNEGNLVVIKKEVFDIYDKYLTKLDDTLEATSSNLERIDDSINQTSGFRSLIAKFPIVTNILKLVVFGLNLCIAGHSITTLIEMQKKKFTPSLFIMEKKKGKNKMKRKVASVANRSFTRFEYDNLKSNFSRYASSAARCKGMVNCIDDYQDICCTDELPINDSAWHMYLQNLKDEQIEKEFDILGEESGKEPVAKQEPAVAIIPTMMVEKTEKKKKKSKKIDILADESLLDPSSRSMVNLASASTVDLGYRNSEGTFERSVYGLMVIGKIGTSVHHFIEADKQAYVKTYKGDKSAIYPIKILRVMEKVDMCIFEIDSKQCPLYPCIIQHMPSYKEDFRKLLETKMGILVTTDRDQDIPEKLIRNVKMLTTSKVISYNSGIQKDCFEYCGFITGLGFPGPVNTAPGDCGSLLIANDTSVNTKFVGFHNSANDIKGAVTMLFKEYFEKYIPMRNESLKLKAVPIKAHKIEYRTETNEALLGMPIVACINEPVCFNQRTKFHTSPLKLPGENPFQPSVLSPVDHRNKTDKHPYFHAIQKWNHPQVDVDKELLQECTDDIAYWYSSVIKNRNIRTKVLTKTEAVNAGQQYALNPLNRASSPGYPWSKREPKVQNFFVNKGSENCAYWGINLEKKSGQMLNTAIDEIIDICRTPGQFPSVAFAGNLKDEPVKVEKIYDVNTRSFGGAPLDYTIASRMYFATIQGAIHQVRDEMPIQIGIDPTSLEWNNLISRLETISDKGFDLDFKGWDGTVQSAFTTQLPIIYNQIAKATNPDWTPEDDVIRQGLCNATVKPRLVVGLKGQTLIIRAPGGMPSGSPRTADDNSLLHLLKFWYCVKRILIRSGLGNVANIMSIRKLIDAIIFGDDGGYAIHPTLLPYVNFNTVQKEFVLLGMTCTAASKDGKDLAYQPVTDLEFLKRTTVKIGAFYYGALQKKTFHKMLGYCLGKPHYWYKTPWEQSYVENDLKQTADSALHEAIFHGEEYYEEMKVHLESALAKIGVLHVMPRYRDIISMKALPIPLSSSSKMKQ